MHHLARRCLAHPLLLVLTYRLTHALDAAQHLHLTATGKLYHARGQAYATLGDFDRARHDYECALDTARTASDGLMEWQSMMALGFLWAERNYAQAGAWFRQALDQASRQDSPLLRARSLNRFGHNNSRLTGLYLSRTDCGVGG